MADSKQVNFRMTDEIQKEWNDLKSQMEGMKNDDLFGEMVVSFKESKSLAMAKHASELKDIDETLHAVTTQLIAVLDKDEARRKASILAAEQKEADAKAALEAAQEQNDRLQKENSDLRKELDKAKAEAARLGADLDYTKEQLKAALALRKELDAQEG